MCRKVLSALFNVGQRNMTDIQVKLSSFHAHRAQRTPMGTDSNESTGNGFIEEEILKPTKLSANL